jgi:hypothetical protein
MESCIDKDTELPTKIPIAGYVRFDWRTQKVYEEVIDTDGTIKRRTIAGNLVIDRQPTEECEKNQYKVIEEYLGKKNLVTGTIRVGLAEGKNSLLEIKYNEDGTMVYKRKIDGVLRAQPAFGQRLMEIFDDYDLDEQLLDRDITGYLKKVVDIEGSEQLIEQSINHLGEKRTRPIKGVIKIVHAQRGSLEANYMSSNRSRATESVQLMTYESNLSGQSGSLPTQRKRNSLVEIKNSPKKRQEVDLEGGIYLHADSFRGQ